MDPLSGQHGFDLAAIRETDAHPENKTAWEKRRDGLKRVHNRVNELSAEHAEHEARIAALEAKLAARPF